jgi:hypothetical protein
LVLRVDGGLAFDRVPPGDEQDFFTNHAGNTPPAQFDFFPFCDIYRLFYCMPLLRAARLRAQAPNGNKADPSILYNGPLPAA